MSTDTPNSYKTSATNRPGGSYSGQDQSSAAERLKQDTGTAAKQAKQYASDLASQATDEATKAKAIGEKKIRQATESVKATSRDYAKQKKSQAASEVGVFRDALQKAADKLSEDDHAGVASYVSAAAEQLDRLRESIEDRNVSDLLGEAQRVARKHPEVVYGGLFVAGLALMRFLKASNDFSGPSEHASGYSDKSQQPGQHRHGRPAITDLAATCTSAVSDRQRGRTAATDGGTAFINPRPDA